MGSDIFLDFHRCLAMTSGHTINDRVQDFASNIKSGAYIVAIGGFPIESDNDQLLWLGTSITADRAQAAIRSGLGTSALMTYMNRSNLSLERLGQICVERDHDWGFHWITLSILFVGSTREAELAFSRDTRFWMSWPIGDTSGRLFMASASIKTWLKFTANRYSSDWDSASRAAMITAWGLLDNLFQDTTQSHFLVSSSAHEKAISQLPIAGRRIIDIGIGHGELAKIVLQFHPVSQLIGFEIVKRPLLLSDPRVCVLYGDARTMIPLIAMHPDDALISNPPYKLLPWIRDNVLSKIHDALLLIPDHARISFPDFDVVDVLSGNVFTPQSTGSHLLIKRGFES